MSTSAAEEISLDPGLSKLLRDREIPARNVPVAGAHGYVDLGLVPSPA
jgi:hypothetical protein